MIDFAAAQETGHKSDTGSPMDKWFEDLIDSFRALQKRLENDQSNTQERNLVETLMSGSEKEVAAAAKNTGSLILVKNIIWDYLKLIQTFIPEKLAMHYNDSEVLVWAELKDDDWSTEKALILAEAKIKANYSKHGYNMVSTFVEKSDDIGIPAHYKVFKS